MAGLLLKIFWYDAESVTVSSHTSGRPGIQAQRNSPIFITTVKTRHRAMQASSWLAMPKSGNSVLMPPSGSVTPMTRIEPQPMTTIAEQTQAPTRQDGSLNFPRPGMLPIASENMKRATRVPASMVVRMNSASNITAKWYQKAFMPAPPKKDMTCDIPKASVGAPPVRETMDFSWTSAAAWAILPAVAGSSAPPPGECSGRVLAHAAAVSGVPPVTPLGAFMTKYRCWSRMQAVMSAMIATNDSVSMPP